MFKFTVVSLSTKETLSDAHALLHVVHSLVNSYYNTLICHIIVQESLSEKSFGGNQVMHGLPIKYVKYSHSMHYNMLKSLFVSVQFVPNCMVIIACNIATFSYCTLN